MISEAHIWLLIGIVATAIVGISHNFYWIAKPTGHQAASRVTALPSTATSE